MATRKTKFSISIEKLKIEFEGTQELGQQIHQGVTQALGGLMNTHARVLAQGDEPAQVVEARALDAGEPQGSGQASPEANGEKSKAPRPRRRSGVSLIGLLRALKQEGFFGQPRPVSEIKDRLQVKGHNYTESNISARLQDLIKRDELFRHKSGDDSPYVYKDAPFNEGPRSPGSPELASE